MGRTYYPKSKKAKGNIGHTFDVNVAGTQVLNEVHREIGFGTQHHRDLDWFIDRLADVKEEECLEAAEKIKNLTSEQKEGIYKWCKRLVESRMAFDQLLDEWVDFLETCRGYDVPQ